SFVYDHFIPNPTFAQSGFRFYANADSTTPGAGLAGDGANATLANPGDAFRLRLLLHIGANQLVVSGKNFKLQFVYKGPGTCASPTGGTPATYTDVTTTTAIAYNNNATPTDGSNISLDAVNDPTHGADTLVAETYEELNDFTNSQAAIPSGQDGEWDLSLIDNGAPATTTYCLRAYNSTDNVVLDGGYSVYPEITTATPASGPTTDQVLRHGNWFNSGVEQSFFWAK